MYLHDEIMNMPVDKQKLECARYDARRAYPRGNLDSAIDAAYRRGHRDACHAADELVAREGSKKAMPEWATKIFTCPKCGSNSFGTDELNDGTLVRHCNRPGCGFRWNSVEDDMCFAQQSKASMTGYGGHTEDAEDATNTEQDLDPLRAYEVELGLLPNALTIGSLIVSHRYLRRECIRLRDEKQAGFNAGYTEGLKDGKTQALDHISIERLRGMTVDEICTLLSSSDHKEEEKDEP